jgi:DNA-binding NarL/FixJ family response regulator
VPDDGDGGGDGGDNSHRDYSNGVREPITGGLPAAGTKPPGLTPWEDRMTALIEGTAGTMARDAREAGYTALVVAADPDLRAALAARLRALGAGVVLEAASAAEARSRVRMGARGRLCVTEGVLPDGSGPGVVAELRRAGWTHGLVVSATGDPYSVRSALVAGAKGFIVTRASVDPEDLDVPVRPIGRRGGASGGPQGLSAREVEVLHLVASGCSNREIGTALGLSALTVKSHLARIARKLGTGDRAEMVAVALRARVIT